MRVISDFHDYYDISIQNGIDPNLIFERKEFIIDEEGVDIYPYKSEIKVNHESLKSLYTLATKVPSYVEHQFSFVPYIVGFCGKFYLIYHHEKALSREPKMFFYSAEKVCDFIEKNKLIPEFNNKKKRSWFYRTQFHKREVEEAFAKVSDFKNDDVFMDLNVPITISTIRGNTHFNNRYQMTSLWQTKVNSNLSDIGFNHVVDPFTAFQELSMFIGGVLGNKEKEVSDIPDLYKIGQKGFDVKKSFRKESPTKKG